MFYHGDTEGTKKARRWNNSIIRQFNNERMEDWKIGRCFTTEHGEHKESTKMGQFDNSTMEE